MLRVLFRDSVSGCVQVSQVSLHLDSCRALAQEHPGPRRGKSNRSSNRSNGRPSMAWPSRRHARDQDGGANTEYGLLHGGSGDGAWADALPGAVRERHRQSHREGSVRRERLRGLLTFHYRKTAAPVRSEYWDGTGNGKIIRDGIPGWRSTDLDYSIVSPCFSHTALTSSRFVSLRWEAASRAAPASPCLLYTSDAADE